MRTLGWVFAAALIVGGAAFAAEPPMAPMPGMAPAPATPAKPIVVKETVIVGPTGKTLVITPALLAGLPRDEASMINHSVSHKYEGVVLTALLKLVDAPTGARVHEAAVKDYLVITGGDGFRAVLDLAETDSSVQAHPVILADTMDGAPLPAHDAPYRIVIDGDRKPSRSVYAVERIEVKVLP